MKVLLLYDYPASPSGLATQGELLYRGLCDLGVEAFPVNLAAAKEKEWYYRWFRPDVVVGIGYWGHTPQIVLHPQHHGMLAVPWLVADGYIANYREVLNELPLILVTSNWVKGAYIRDGIQGAHIAVLPVGCDTDCFLSRSPDDPKVAAIRDSLSIMPDEVMILTVGGDAASKGAQEVMQALASLGTSSAGWKYVCKVWPQERTMRQNLIDLQLATELGIDERVLYYTNIVSRNYMPYLMAACDIYAAPSRLEGFGMPHVEAGACGKPVVSIKAMGMLDTLIHGETAYLARVAVENRIHEMVLGPESGYEGNHRVVFDVPRIADYRANVKDIARYLVRLIESRDLREKMGAAGRRRVVAQFDYRVVARQFVQLLAEHLGIN
jgi:alpha-maltose-1-phosphate synthase